MNINTNYEAIKVPERHEPGSFSVRGITGGTGEFVLKYANSCLGYELDGPEIALYDVSESDLETLTAHYGDDWKLKQITLGDRLVYIAYESDDAAWSAIRDAADENGRRIAAQVAAAEGTVGRVFVEYYRDWEGFDFGVIVADEKELWKVAARSEDEDCVNMSGEYDHSNKICADNQRFSVMLACLPKGMAVGLTGMSIEIMTEAVRSACDSLTKSKDFDFIAEEYD